MRIRAYRFMYTGECKDETYTFYLTILRHLLQRYYRKIVWFKGRGRRPAYLIHNATISRPIAEGLISSLEKGGRFIIAIIDPHKIIYEALVKGREALGVLVLGDGTRIGKPVKVDTKCPVEELLESIEDPYVRQRLDGLIEEWDLTEEEVREITRLHSVGIELNEAFEAILTKENRLYRQVRSFYLVKGKTWEEASRIAKQVVERELQRGTLKPIQEVRA